MSTVHKYQRQFLYSVETSTVTVVVGEPGSGRSTQLPQYLLQAGWASEGKVIACTQPRHSLVAQLAQQASQETNTELGTTIGYSVQFSSMCDPETTRIKYITDDILVRECLVDPLLSKYSVIIVDQFHERSIATDTLLALLKKILRKRKDSLRLVISTVAFDSTRLEHYFTQKDRTGDKIKVMSISESVFPVDIHFLEEPCEDYVKCAVETVLAIHQNEAPGDILVFLSGMDDINTAIQILGDTQMPLVSQSIKVMALYLGLSTKERLLVLDKPPVGTRKIVFATDIAETSVTVPGISYVVDSGFSEMRVFDPDAQIERLAILPISKTSARLRADRAGHTSTGKVYRLYTQAAFKTSLFPDYDTPNVRRLSLTPMILMLMLLGVENVVRFDYFEPPPPELLSKALEHLAGLGVITKDTGKLTPDLGLHMAELPLAPELGVCLLNSVQKYGCGREAMAAIAMMSMGIHPFVFSYDQRAEAAENIKEFMVKEGDILTLVNVLIGYQKTPKRARQHWCQMHFLDSRLLNQADRISRQLEAWLNKLGFSRKTIEKTASHYPELLQKCLASCLFANAARMNLQDGRYHLVSTGTVVDIHPTSIFFRMDRSQLPEYVVFSQAIETTKLYIRGLTMVEPSWLVDAAPDFYKITKTKR
ncbi:hypothetical protein GGI05_000989 [Coemansia sp. RSA 2603]|nr:hypothetical protein GGI05_000989 [Coemansia sp. RSA 2603]